MEKQLKRLISISAPTLACSLFIIIFLSPISQAFAEQPQAQSEASQEIASQQDERTVFSNVMKAAIVGPKQISLIDQGTLNLPQGYFFIPSKQAAMYMRAIGNQTGPELAGIVMSTSDDSSWFISIDYIKSGYVKDDEAKTWKADDLLNSLKQGTEEGNKERLSKGFLPLEVAGWIEPPAYDASTHRLIWSMLARHSELEPESKYVVNHSTYILGRDGYFELDLVTSNSSIAEDKLEAQKILASIDYNEGKRYEDFNSKTDTVAEYGIAALVTGIAAKKLGLIALAGAFLVKMWKLVILTPLIFWGKIKNYFNSDSTSEADNTK